MPCNKDYCGIVLLFLGGVLLVLAGVDPEQVMGAVVFIAILPYLVFIAVFLLMVGLTIILLPFALLERELINHNSIVAI